VCCAACVEVTTAWAPKLAPQSPEASAFIDDKYMKMVEADPKLKAYANKAD